MRPALFIEPAQDGLGLVVAQAAAPHRPRLQRPVAAGDGIGNCAVEVAQTPGLPLRICFSLACFDGSDRRQNVDLEVAAGAQPAIDLAEVLQVRRVAEFRLHGIGGCFQAGWTSVGIPEPLFS
jgi:hypothetical protein